MTIAAVVAFSISPLSASSGAGAYDRSSDVRAQDDDRSDTGVEGRSASYFRAAPAANGGVARSPASSVTAAVSLGQSLERCRSARTGLAWYRGRQADWLKLRGVQSTPADRQAPRKPRNCADARYLAGVAKARSFRTRVAYERWNERRTLRDFPVRAGVNAWLRAIVEAQRAYPGTSSWLRSCSSTEGGWGRWVPNSDGAPPGGWLQFYESTFWRMWSTARADVLRRGFRVPRSAHSWYSPLGQALAGAWGLTNGRRHEWNSSGC